MTGTAGGPIAGEAAVAAREAMLRAKMPADNETVSSRA